MAKKQEKEPKKTSRRTTSTAVAVLAIIALFLYFYSPVDFMPDFNSATGAIYYDATSVVLPKECEEHTENVCELFACMTANCWCDELNPDGPILKEGGQNITSTIAAKNYVIYYLRDKDGKVIPEYVPETVTQLNEVFYNVFAYNDDRDELMVTVAVDGTILDTICAV